MSADEQHSKAVRLATNAYHAALARDWHKAERVLKRLNEECTGEGLFTALKAWCDTFINHASDGGEVGRFRMVGWNVDTGAVNESEVRASVAWSRRLIAARAAMDLEAFNTVLQELNDIPDGFERGRYVAELLECVALTVNSLPRGYGRMGASS
ncbi:hypothetical protein Drose_04460 [Dactylosporangium roseum]|uniref:Uncharacterized protein n=1 Tax=Dactylosporangium roseum TaxID=47989 RepID=A0ABY5Z9Q1_9ACTN|nr:hypothetical protein [Dactylosporangium roseum]UWZ37542.1 hypothetical protein Drose_04460 [Dactylosporangium roseum]